MTTTDPTAGTSVSRSARSITVYYSTGYIEVPSVVGDTRTRRPRKLTDLGFVAGRVERRVRRAADQVVAQDPAAEDRAAVRRRRSSSASRWARPRRPPADRAHHAPTTTTTTDARAPRPADADPRSSAPRHRGRHRSPVTRSSDAETADVRAGSRPSRSRATRGPLYGWTVSDVGLVAQRPAEVVRRLRCTAGRSAPRATPAARVVQRDRVADRRDPVRRRVRHALQDHGVADALDAGGADDPLALQADALGTAAHSALTTAWMSCWCTTSRLGSMSSVPGWSRGASSRVTTSPGPLELVEPGRRRRSGRAGASARRSWSPLHLLARARRLGLGAPRTVAPQILDLAALLAHQPDQVGVPAAAQVGAAGVDHRRRRQQAGAHAHDRDREPPAERPTRASTTRRGMPSASARRSGACADRSAATLPALGYGTAHRRLILPNTVDPEARLGVEHR